MHVHVAEPLAGGSPAGCPSAATAQAVSAAGPAGAPSTHRGSCPMAWGINSCSLPSRRKRHDHTRRSLTAALPAVPGTPRVPAAALPLLAGRHLGARIWNRLCKRWQIATWSRAWVFRKSRDGEGQADGAPCRGEAGFVPRVSEVTGVAPREVLGETVGGRAP